MKTSFKISFVVFKLFKFYNYSYTDLLYQEVVFLLAKLISISFAVLLPCRVLSRGSTCSLFKFCVLLALLCYIFAELYSLAGFKLPLNLAFSGVFTSFAALYIFFPS